jgi:hypothetical protein
LATYLHSVRPAILLVTTVVLVAGCAGGHEHAGRPAPSTVPVPVPTVITVGAIPSPFPVVSLACAAGDPNPVAAHALFEIEGHAVGGTLWALVFDDHPFTVAHQVKIAWRMSGSGPLRLSATNLDTHQTVPAWTGPDPHSSSSWHRPGDEWGSSWVFPTAGCWQITASRTTVTGAVTVTVNGLSE